MDLRTLGSRRALTANCGLLLQREPAQIHPHAGRPASLVFATMGEAA